MKSRIYWGLAILIILLVGVSVVLLTRTTDTKPEFVYIDREPSTVDYVSKKQPTEPKQLTEPIGHYHADGSFHEGTHVEHANVASGPKSERPRYKEGIYKGLTFSEAAGVWADKIRENRDKEDKIIRKIDELATIRRTYSDAQKSLTLSFLKTIPSEEREKAKTIMLKMEPHDSNEIESFFNQINTAETQTLDHIKIDSKTLQALEDAADEAWKKVWQESDSIDQEIERLLPERPRLEDL